MGWVGRIPPFTKKNEDSHSVTMSAKEDKPLVSVGEKITLEWAEEGGKSRTIHAKVVSVTLSSKKKHGSYYKYELSLYKENNEIISTRLANLPWERKSKSSKRARNDEVTETVSTPVVTESDGTNAKKQKVNPVKSGANKTFHTGITPESLQYIVAPMVGGSELAFRLLCRKYGATIAYTPMMSSERFVVDEEYRKTEFQTTPEDRPLVAHFSANDPKVFLQAALLAQDKCDAIDLNLGCPQRVAHSGHFGSYLLDPEDRPLVLSMVKELSSKLRVPLFVKIRLLNTIEESVELCQQLVAAGAALIAIHARYRVNLVGRSGPGARDGAAHLDQVRTIRAAIDPKIPIIANGNVITWEDVQKNREETHTQGIMSAEGLLDDPALFNGGTKVDKFQLAVEYLNNVALHPVKMKSVVFHIRRMCREELTQYQLLEDVVAAKNVDEVRQVVLQGMAYRDNGNYKHDPDKAKRAKEALERRKYEEGKRKAYEERMVRKAKREGKELDFYLRQGIEPPTEDAIKELKAMTKEKAFEVWKAKYPQHCYALHLQEGGCTRDRTCSFLHSDSRVAEAVAYG